MSKINFFEDFFNALDVVQFVEQCLILEGQPMKVTGNGREFVADIMRYAAHVLPYSQNAKPVVVLKGRQVGMSTTTAALMLYFMYAEKHKAFAHFFPDVGHARRHSSKRFIEMIEDSINNGRLPREFLNKAGTQSQAQKDFQNSNTAYIEGVSTDARRVRGMSISGLPIYDEFGETTRSAYKVSLDAAANTHFGYVDHGRQIPHLVFGTPLEEGSLFQDIWNKSNKQEYHFKCIHCGHYFPLFYEVITRTEVFTNLIQGTLIKCLDQHGQGCQKIMDKKSDAMKNGKWASTLPVDAPYDFVGFYVPQYLSAIITREVVDHKRLNDPPREFYNECLGKFYSAQEDVLTAAQIQKLVTENPPTGEWDLPAFIKDKKTFMGIDWGLRVSGDEDSGQGSYTVITILSHLPTGQLKLEHAIRLTMKDIDEQIQVVNDLARKFNVLKIVADRGAGEAQWQRLEKYHGVDRFTPCQWSGNMKRTFTYTKDLNLITAAKHSVHEEFFDLLRQGKFCFPNSSRAEEEIGWIYEHMSNIDVVLKEANGMIKKFYEKKRGKPTDGLASLVFAYTAFLFVKTQGFIMTNSQISSAAPSSKRSLLSTASILPTRPSAGHSSNNSINYSRSDRRRIR